MSDSSAGKQGNGDSSSPAISPDGHFVAFLSQASNLVPGDTNGSPDVFVRGHFRDLRNRKPLLPAREAGVTHGAATAHRPCVVTREG